jgi:hypothetical protein
MRLQGGAPDLAASVDGAYVACAGETLTLYAQATRAVIASAPLDGPADVAFLGADRLLVVTRGDGRSQLQGFALPSLEPIAALELEDRLMVLTAVGGRALVTNETLEQPRVVAVTSKIIVDPIALREPLQLAAAAPEERLLVASRTREAQLECWDPGIRRALFRLNLPLLPQARLAGFSARRRLLWIAAGGPAGVIEVFRYSDGRLQARVELGATIVGATGHPESPRLVVATRKRDEDPVELTELDFQAVERRELTAPVSPRAICVVEGAQPALVLLAGEAPTWLPLAPAMAADGKAAKAAPATAPAGTASAAVGERRPHPRVADPADWRDKLQAAKAAGAPASGASPPARTAPSPIERARPARARDQRPEEALETEERPAHWRDELCDWVEQQLAAPRRPLGAPAPADDSTLATVIARLALDERAARALQLVYGARLLGHADLPAATVARALGRDGDADADDWDEALGRGLLGRLGLVRTRRGRLGMSVAAARFLDGAPPRVPILPGGASEAELPDGRVRLDGAAEPLAAIGARLAQQYGYDVALVLVEGPAPARMLACKLVEARLHGAWPVVDVSAKAARWTDALDDGPTVIVVRGDEVPAAIAALQAL